MLSCVMLVDKYSLLSRFKVLTYSDRCDVSHSLPLSVFFLPIFFFSSFFLEVSGDLANLAVLFCVFW